jgi:transcriptional regulator of acetoin/glycerol metabolism
MTTDGNRISSKNLPAYVLQAVNQGGSDEPLGKILVQQERDILLSTLLKTQYNCAKTAKALGIHRGTLYSKLEKYGIDIAKMRQSHTDSHTTDSATFAV